MIRYVDQQTIEMNKYDYAKTMRAQLSTHEQALLLINSLTPIGQNWWKNELIDTYRLVKNLPRDFFDSSVELDVGKLFKLQYFEWEETNPAVKNLRCGLAHPHSSMPPQIARGAVKEGTPDGVVLGGGDGYLEFDGVLKPAFQMRHCGFPVFLCSMLSDD